MILGNSLTIVNGKRWLKMRKLLTPAFHAEILKPYTKLFQESTRTLLVSHYRKGGSTLRTECLARTYNHILLYIKTMKTVERAWIFVQGPLSHAFLLTLPHSFMLLWGDCKWISQSSCFSLGLVINGLKWVLLTNSVTAIQGIICQAWPYLFLLAGQVVSTSRWHGVLPWHWFDGTWLHTEVCL